MEIRISRTENSKLRYIDFDNIPFGKYTTDHMFVMGYVQGQGTAAGVSHIAEVTHGDNHMILPKTEERIVSNMLYDEINGLRSGRIEDKRKWLVPVEVNI